MPVPAAYGFISGEPVGPTPVTDRDTDGNGRPDGVRVLQVEGDAAFRWRGLALDGEAYYRHESWSDVGTLQPPAAQFLPHQSFGGIFAQPTMFVAPARFRQARAFR